ncbi:MAG: hypothetical protein AMXMBFR47_38910 [Planctomycetota bacterium]
MRIAAHAEPTLGRVRARAAAGPFTLCAIEHAPGHMIPAHRHSSFHLCCVIDGRLIEGAAGREIECLPGTLILKPLGVEHWNRIGSAGCHSLAVSWDASAPAAIFEHLGPWDDVRVSRFPPASTLATRIHASLLRGGDVCPLALEGLTLELLATFGRPPDVDQRYPIPAWLRTVRQAIQAELPEFRGLRCLAARVGVHPVHLARAHREKFGCTIGEYLREIRIARAKRLLSATDETIAQIASSLGFADQAHLTRLFRRSTGMTPAAYRRRARSDAPQFGVSGEGGSSPGI